jgi:hypothetical protein
MQRLVKPWKLRYQTSTRPSSIGTLRSTGACAKCSSIARAPASSSRKRSAPIAIAIGRPIADHSE